MVSGKVYYELQAEMEKRNVDKSKFAITRVEQVAPFPFDEVQEQVNKYPGAEVVWAQEEHQNMGAYSYVAPRINALLQNKGKLPYFGRPPGAAAATGSSKVHAQEAETFFSTVFKL